MSRPSDHDIGLFLSQRFSGFRIVESRAGFPADIKVADFHDIRAAILCEFGIDAAVSFVDGAVHVEVLP